MLNFKYLVDTDLFFHFDFFLITELMFIKCNYAVSCMYNQLQLTKKDRQMFKNAKTSLTNELFKNLFLIIYIFEFSEI